MNTKELLRTIKSLRNINSFANEEISRKDIEIILKSATWAPNHKNPEKDSTT